MAQTFIDYYAVLGVPETANEEALRTAYREAARRYHPDANKAPGANAIFKDINTAYEVLTSTGERAEFDKLRRESAQRFGGMEMEITFSQPALARLPEPQMLYALARFKPTTEADERPQAPLNLTLLIDRSKSMQGERLRHVKTAAHRIIDQANEDDVLSVIAFNDFAEVIVDAQRLNDPRAMKAHISTIRADGSTALRAGMVLGLEQLRKYRHPRFVNHMLLVTDGRTYDEQECLDLARGARDDGIGISGMGIGEDWNDSFLDEMASLTGGYATYINNESGVLDFMNNRIRTLSAAYAERCKLVVAPTGSAALASIVRLSPDTAVLPMEPQPLMLGAIDGTAHTSLLLEIHVDTSSFEGDKMLLGRIDVRADVLGGEHRTERVMKDMWIAVKDKVERVPPPPEMVDALSKLRLYRLQERAREAFKEGNIAEATRYLENLATRLFESGEEELAQAALMEANRVKHTQALSEEGALKLKYGTRALFLPSPAQEG